MIGYSKANNLMKESDHMNNTRIFALNREISNNTHVTRLNNNDLIIGSTGSGKTTGYVIPNILRSEESIIVSDTKGQLYRQLADILASKGFKIDVLDFADPFGNSGFNPLDNIRINKSGYPNEQDIRTIAYALIPDDVCKADIFWPSSARQVIICLIAYVMEAFERNDRNLITVTETFKIMNRQMNESNNKSIRFLDEWCLTHPESLAARQYSMFKAGFAADRTWASIQQFVSMALEIFDSENSRALFSSRGSLNIKKLGRQKSILFLNTSDTDHSMDRIINLFYTQALHILCKEADRSPSGRLDVPVRIILDDFAAGVMIQDFDKLISVIRSREISVSVILQSITQLNTCYSKAQATTILNGCDHVIYLGGNDMDTASYIADRVSRTVDKVLNMPNDKICLLERGKKGEIIDKVMPDYMPDLLSYDDDPDDPDYFERHDNDENYDDPVLFDGELPW